MRMNICFCLLALVLGCNVTAEENRTSPSTTPTTTTAPPKTTTEEEENHDEGPTSAEDKDDNTGPTSPTTNSTTSPSAENTGQDSSLILVVGIVVSFLLVLIIITVYCAWRCKRRETKERHHIYDEIRDEGLNPTKRVESSGGPSAEYCLVTFPDTSLTESPYSMITNPLPDGKTGTPQLNDPTYSLLEKPKVLENNDQYLHSFT